MRPASIEMLANLVGFDTTSRNSNLPLIRFVREFLDTHGVFHRVSTSEDGAKASIHAVIGPREPGGIALSGHVDTVPVDGQAWSADPFTLRRERGRLIGRGAVDMKGFVACCLAAVPDFMAMRLTTPLHLFISYDEETDFAGARRLVADITESGLRPELCVVGEPSGMQPIVAHKGRLAARVAVRGKPGHSSRPAQGVNAIAAAAEAIVWLAAEARRAENEGPFEDGFDPPHSTIHVGRIEGGTALNIIPEHAEFLVEWRTIPGDAPQSAARCVRGPSRDRRSSRRCAASIRPAVSRSPCATWLPGLSLPPAHPLAALVSRLTGAATSGKVSYGTEAGLYQQAGIAAIVCGPGDIAQAHQPDEWIAESELARCDAFLRGIAQHLAS